MSKPTCMYLVLGDAGRKPCGGAARWWRNTPGGLFYYCDTCAATARDLAARAKIKANLHPIQ